MLGYSLRRMGRLPEAIEAYDRALAINPKFGQALEYRGIAHLKAGNQRGRPSGPSIARAPGLSHGSRPEGSHRPGGRELGPVRTGRYFQ